MDAIDLTGRTAIVSGASSGIGLDGLDPVTPDEVADCVMFALTRPPHVNLDEIVIKAIAQSSGSHVVRRQS